MKRRSLLLLTLLLCFPALVQAQANQATTIQSLAVDLWPDYDQTSVLVLFTGMLPADTSLPATVTIPLPNGVSLNAVARIDAANQMIDDIQFTQAADSVTLTTPDSRFRIEYYMPYEADGNDRSFTFSWLADVSVEQLEVSIQQPSAADSMDIIPAPANSTVGSVDNLTYHILPTSSVGAGERYEVNVGYTMAIPQLSTNQIDQQPQSSQTAVSPPQTVAASSSNNLPLILGIVGGVLIVGVLAWALVNNQKTTPRPRKPQPRKTAVKAQPIPTRPAPAAKSTKFCHECGVSLQAGDKFCRACGTAVKNS